MTPKTKAAHMLATAMERVFFSMHKEFAKLPEYTPVELLIRNSRVPTGVTSNKHKAYPALTLLTGVDSVYIYKRLLNNEFEEIEDFSLENAMLRTFGGAYELYSLSTVKVSHIEKKKFTVPVGLFTTNSQDELVICPWFIG